MRARTPGTRAFALLTVSVFLVMRGLQSQQSAPAPASAVPPDATRQIQATETTAAAAMLPAFDVVSITTQKDEGMGKIRSGISATPDGFQADGVPLQILDRQAFGVSDDRILNEPDWVKAARFDLDAKVASEDAPALTALSMPERSAMLLPVLEDCFGVKSHHELKELEVNTLVDAKSGPKLKVTTSGDAVKKDQPQSAASGKDAPPKERRRRGPHQAALQPEETGC